MKINSLNFFVSKILKPNYEVNFWSQTAWAILRAVVGVMMIHNGLDKPEVSSGKKSPEPQLSQTY